jgi:hypothetical protein
MHAFVPVGSEMFFEDPVFDPVVSHVPGFRTFGLHERCVCFKNGGGWLRVLTDGNEGITNRDGILRIVEYSTTFGFGGRSYNTSQGVAFCVNRAVRSWWAWLGRWWSGEITKEVLAGNSTARLGEYKICRICIHVEYHLASMVPDHGIG